MSDPVAEKSGFLCMYMSHHPDTLVAWAKYYGNVEDTEDIITGAQMIAIDSKSISLSCTLKSGSKQEIRIDIEPPLKSYDDVKPRLLEMKATAQEKLGMIQMPRITTFHMAFDAWIITATVASLIYLTWSPRNSSLPIFYPAKLAHTTLNSKYIDGVTHLVLGVHVLESLYTLRLCRRHKTGFVLGSAYMMATLFSGFPIWRDIRRRVQAARIQSVTKTQ